MLRKTLDLLYDAAGYLAAFFVFLICMIMVIASIMRQTGFRTGGTDDIVSWITAAAAFLGLAHTFKHGDFVRVGLLIEMLGPKMRRLAEFIALLIATVFVGYMAWAIITYVHTSYVLKDMANGLVVIPKWIPQSSVAVGCVLLFVALFDELVMVVRNRIPTYVRAVEERHARGDFSEDV